MSQTSCRVLKYSALLYKTWRALFAEVYPVSTGNVELSWSMCKHVVTKTEESKKYKENLCNTKAIIEKPC